MKQIKTIMHRMDTPGDWETFDREVNKAIAEGWALVKRDVLRPYEGPHHVFYRMLYAELEREQKCFNCKNISTEACRECNPDTMDRWEQGKELAVVPVAPVKKR